MKKGKVLVLALALLALVAGTAQGEMYVEAYLGGVFPPAASMGTTTVHQHSWWINPANPAYLWEDHSINGHFDPAFQGGLKLGAWFERSGVLSGINFPAWMKYLGFYVDVSYHRLDIRRERMTTRATATVPGFGTNQGFVPDRFKNDFWSEGHAFTLAFMFAVRYGFLKDSEVPFGRLQPYLAVGPALLFSSMSPALQSCINYSSPAQLPFAVVIPYTLKPNSDSAVNVALAVETGLRWMALKNVSVDVSFKYRYAKPSYTFNYVDRLVMPTTYGPINTSINLSPTLHLLSFQVGAAYHF